MAEKKEASAASVPKAEEEEKKEAGGLGLGRGDDDDDDDDDDDEGSMKPWEQHSAVISIPRYDYKAPSSLLGRSHSGFLITCPIKREKSATKEAICMLEEYVGRTYSNGSKRLETCDVNVSAKKRKVGSQDTIADNVETTEKSRDGTSEISGKGTEESILPSSETPENAKCNLNLSLVKLTRSGLLLFTFPTNDFRHVGDILSNMFLSLGSRNLKQPLWCHRIFPIQETCILIEKDLKLVVSKLTREFLGSDQEKLEKPIKFAVGYNRRGIEETEMKKLKSPGDDSQGLALLDRDRCFKVVAGAFKDVAKNSVVDLKSPEVAVLVELLPISGIPRESIVVGVSILPYELIVTKPRLCVKPLVTDTKANKRRD